MVLQTRIIACLFFVQEPEEALMEPRLRQQNAIADVHQLTGCGQVEQLRQIDITEKIDVVNRGRICCDMVVFGGFTAVGKSILESLAEQGRIFFGHDANGLQPVGAGGFDMDMSLGDAVQRREHAEFSEPEWRLSL